MGTPSPFETARFVGNKVAGAFREVKDENAIESILSTAMQSNDPAILQNSIGKILSQVSPERQGAAIEYLQQAHNNIQARQSQEMQRRAALQAGINPDLPPAVQAAQFKEASKNKRINDVYGQPSQPMQAPVGNSVGSPSIQTRTSPFKDKSKDELVILSGHPDREVSEPAKQTLSTLEADERENREDKRSKRKEEIKFHEETQKYDEDLLKQTKIAKKQFETFNDIDKALNSGNVRPASLTNLFKGLGRFGDKISEAITNKDEATLLASIPQLLEGWKEVFGVRLSDADLAILQEKLPSIGKNVEANRAILKVMKKYADTTLLRQKIAADLKKANNGLRPLGYVDKIEERFDEMTTPVNVISPISGKTISIPAYKVSEAIQSGAKLADG